MLFKSKAFWTCLVDAVVGSVMLVIDLTQPEIKMTAVTIWGIWQPLVVLVIANFATETAALRVARLLYAKDQPK